jgi:hypothetical protein
MITIQTITWLWLAFMAQGLPAAEALNRALQVINNFRIF